MSSRLGFRRIVLELGHGDADPEIIRQAAILAGWLNAELHALYIEDTTLRDVSQIPFAREINAISLQWRRLEASRLDTDLRAAVDRARRHLTEAARLSGVRPHFETHSGDVVCLESDIVVVAQRAERHYPDALDRSDASVLFLPRGRLPRHGSIVALTSEPGGPEVAIARAIAERAREHLMVLPTPGTNPERLIVVARDGPFGDQGAALAALKGVPVLVVGGGRTAA